MALPDFLFVLQDLIDMTKLYFMEKVARGTSGYNKPLQLFAEKATNFSVKTSNK